MNEKRFKDIMKNADERTIKELSRSVPLTDGDRKRIFAESMRKLREKQQQNAPTRIIMNRGGSGRTEEINEDESTASVKTGSYKTIVSIAASLALMLGISGAVFLNSSRIGTSGTGSAPEEPAVTAVTSAPMPTESAAEVIGEKEKAFEPRNAVPGDDDVTAGTTFSEAQPVPADPQVIIPDVTEATTAQPGSYVTMSEETIAGATYSGGDPQADADYISVENDLLDKLNESIALVGSGFQFSTSDEMFDENFELIDPDDEDSYARFAYARITGGLTTYDEITEYLRSFMAQDYYEFYFRKYIKGGGRAVIAEHDGELYRDLRNAHELSYRYDDPKQPHDVSETEFYFEATRSDFDQEAADYLPTEPTTLHAILEDGTWKIAF